MSIKPACTGCGQQVTAVPPDGYVPQVPGPQSNGPPMGYGGPVCPKCQSTATRPGPWPWYLGTIGAMLVSAKVCTQCGHEFDARKPHADLRKRKLVLALVINGIGLVGIIAVIAMVATVALEHIDSPPVPLDSQLPTPTPDSQLSTLNSRRAPLSYRLSTLQRQRVSASAGQELATATTDAPTSGSAL